MAADWAAIIIPPAKSLPIRVAYLCAGLIMFAWFDALYLGAHDCAQPWHFA